MKNLGSMSNPVADFLGEWLEEPLMKRLFIENPRVAIESKVGVPEDIVMETYLEDGRWVFRSKIPKTPGNRTNDLGQRRIEDQRLKKCPIMGVSEQEIIDDPVGLFSQYGIKIPEDMKVFYDAEESGYIYFECYID